VEKYNGRFPNDSATLELLPGIGPYTARALSVFAYNQSEVLIETNIRTVFIYHFFFRAKRKITDAELRLPIKQTLPEKDFRIWYSALMDYGAYIKKNVKNPSRKSAEHKQQSCFKGSVREIRGRVLRELLIQSKSLRALQKCIPDEKLRSILSTLIQEGFIKGQQKEYRIQNTR